MFAHKIHEHIPTKTYLAWTLLSLSAGSVNSGGYLSCHRFVSHVTGFATLSGVSFAQNNYLDALATLFVPLFFLMGVMISAYFTEKKITSKAYGQKYAPVIGLEGLLLLIVALAGHFHYFGKFGEPALIDRDFLLMSLLCMACGLQNAAITSSSGATIRTTHLTGLTTDLGIGIIRAEIHPLSMEQKLAERRANFIRALGFLSFAMGSAIGAILFTKLNYLGFIFPSFISFYFWQQARTGPKHSTGK